MNQKVPDQIWIPHRPVIRTEVNVMTKIRPVFNCSLKMGKSPSLNGAAFPGIDLMDNCCLCCCTLDQTFMFYCLTSLRHFFRFVWHLKRITDFVSLERLMGNLYLTDTVLSSLDLFLAHSSLIMLYSIIYQIMLLIMFLL